jgi:hypothetical protein
MTRRVSDVVQDAVDGRRKRRRDGDDGDSAGDV